MAKIRGTTVDIKEHVDRKTVKYNDVLGLGQATKYLVTFATLLVMLGLITSPIWLLAWALSSC